MTLYLITHKVRGTLALDIAVKMEMPDGPWWIIPTSGHRAYPGSCVPLNELEHMGQKIMDMPFPLIDGLRDHYEVSRETPAPDYTNRATEPPRSGRPKVPTLEDI